MSPIAGSHRAALAFVVIAVVVLPYKYEIQSQNTDLGLRHSKHTINMKPKAVKHRVPL